MMRDNRQQALVNCALERAADKLGDVTRPVMDLFYARFPDARGSFEQHWPDRPHQLEQEMVGNALYFLMIWFERPAEVKYSLWSSVPHHQATLHVPAHWYAGMMLATIDVIAATTPSEESEEAALWAQMRGDMEQLILNSID